MTRYTAGVREELKHDYERSFAEFEAQRNFREEALMELLGPLYMNFVRSARAFDRWKGRNDHIEGTIIRRCNTTIRDLLVDKAHLIPDGLLQHATKLVEHYDMWLEDFERERSDGTVDDGPSHIFVGPKGYPFPSDAEEAFKEAFKEHRDALYSGGDKPRRSSG